MPRTGSSAVTSSRGYGQFAPSSGYQIAKSLRFRSSASAYLNRTFATPTSTTIWTWSAWVKRGGLTGTYRLFGASTTTFLTFNSSDQLNLTINNVSAATSTAVFRDPSAWYHIVYQQNGSAQTIWVNNQSVATGTTAASVFNTAIAHQIGAANTTNYFDGYLAEVNFIDGQALDPTSFGQTDNNGVWQPKAYTGTYGTNGFYLKFDEVGATTTTNTGYGKDSSGNANRWTTNNFGTTSTATTYDSMLDSPTNFDDGGNGVGNYCVLNPLTLAGSGTGTVSAANLTLTSPAADSTGAQLSGTIGVSSGKYYWEVAFTTLANASGFLCAGIQDASVTVSGLSGSSRGGSATWWISDDGNYRANGGTVTSSGLGSFVAGDIAMIAVDATNKIAWIGKNGTWVGSPSAGTGNTFSSLPATISPFNQAVRNTTTSSVLNANFGQRAFVYTPPSGFKALNTQNLTTPTIANGAQYMNATLYTGNGAARSITGLSFSPDLVWIKSRSNALDNKFTDSVRGVTKALISNTTGAETTDANGLTAFNADGFSLGTDATYNTNTNTYVAWAWDKSVTSGCDIVTYTGNGANRTIAHSLGAIPDMIIVKQRTAASATNWAVYHSSLANTEYLLLNSTAAKATGATYWNSTTPTSSVFSLGTAADVNTSSGTYVAYLWDAVAGYSAFGSYTGNGSTDGPFVYLGFRPRYVLLKRTDTTSNWIILDTSRNTFNVVNNTLWADLSSAESTAYPWLDLLSNGFKFRDSANGLNTSAGTYIYAAFAENPFKISRAR